jgi:hypothetical protein
VAAELALYFPGRVWSSSFPVRNLALLFDGIAILNPSYQKDRFDATPLGAELQRANLLEVFTPGDLYEDDVVAGLAEFLLDVATAPDAERLMVPDDPSAEDYVVTDVGRAGALATASDDLREVFAELHRARLIRNTNDPLRVRMHRDLRIAVLTRAADLLAARERRGVTLRPVTDLTAPAGTEGVMNVAAAAKYWQSVTFADAAVADMTTIGIEEAALAGTRLEDLKRYREEHHAAYDAYRMNLSDYVRQLASAPNETFVRHLRDTRGEALVGAADEVRQVNRARWKGTLRFALSGLAVVLSPLAGLVLFGPAGLLEGGAVSAVGTALEAATLALEASDRPWSGAPTAYSYLVGVPLARHAN